MATARSAIFPRILLGVVGVLPVAQAAPPGSVDPYFGDGDGVQLVDFSERVGLPVNQFEPRGEVDALGRLVVATTIFGVGNASNGLGLARLTANGHFDPDFGSGGLVFLPVAGMVSVAAVRFDDEGRALVAFQLGQGAARLWRTCRFTERGELDATFFGTNCATAAPALGAYLSDMVLTDAGNPWMVGSVTLLDEGVARGHVVVTQVDAGLGATRSQIFKQNAASIGAYAALPLLLGDGIVATGRYAPDGGSSDVPLFAITFGNGEFFFEFMSSFAFDRGDVNEDVGRCVLRQADGKLLVGADVDQNGGQFWGTYRTSAFGVHDAGYASGTGFTIDNVGNVIDYGRNIVLDDCSASRDGGMNLVGRYIFADPLAPGSSSVVPALFRMRDGSRDTVFGGPTAVPGTGHSPAAMLPGVAMHLFRPLQEAYPRVDTGAAAVPTPDGAVLLIGASRRAGEERYDIGVMRLDVERFFRDGFEP
jgi:hypothetical protein